MDDKILGEITPHLLSQRPSTYHLSKALAEQLLAEQKEGLPVAIVRPSIIVGAMREPSNGWIDNYNGLTGYLVAVGKGVLRTLHCKPNFKCDIIPVDIVVNTCLSSAYFVATKRPEMPFVVNCVSGPLNGVTWRQINAICIPLLCATPSEQLFRVPGVSLHSSSWVHFCHLVVEHKIPAFVVDLLFRAFGLKPM